MERINADLKYVPNDIVLDQKGLLLFGVNAAGKSSILKSIALAVYMAHAGMFVAAGEFELTPMEHLFTRMSSQDNIYEGKSTFVSELFELRKILKAANSKTLVVGDEMCNSTESSSAVSIVGATIKILKERKSLFAFATHLHEISKVDVVHDVNICHMGVKYRDGILVYDRVLQEGQGEMLYGLEVAKAMDLGPSFMSIAMGIRRQVLDIQESLVNTRRSKYNKKVYVDVCQSCKVKPAQEVHHMIPQRMADAHGRIGHMNKNASHNLVPLCSDCHDMIHKESREVTWAMTSKGRVLL